MCQGAWHPAGSDGNQLLASLAHLDPLHSLSHLDAKIAGSKEDLAVLHTKPEPGMEGSREAAVLIKGGR